MDTHCVSKRAIILGVTGQDGSYLADILLERGYVVHGLYRRSSVDNLRRIRHLLEGVTCKDFGPRITLHQGDLTDPQSVERAVVEAQPDEIYHVADQDSVGWSFAMPAYSLDVTAGAVGRLLESVRRVRPEARVFIPVSATMFGGSPPPQSEATPLDPQSPYACAKACAYHLARYYRQTHGLFVATAILFNHDSPRRSEDYLLHKIVSSVRRIAHGAQQKLVLGNLDLRVDIGYAREYAEAAVRLLQLDAPDDFAIGTGKGYPIRAIVEAAFAAAGLSQSGRVEGHPYTDRPGAQPVLIADPSKARTAFGFAPKYDACSLAAAMVRGELD